MSKRRWMESVINEAERLPRMPWHRELRRARRAARARGAGRGFGGAGGQPVPPMRAQFEPA